VIVNKFFLILFIIISLKCCNRGKQETKRNGTNPDDIQTVEEKYYGMQTESLVDTLNSMENINYEKRAQLITFINDSLDYNGESYYKEEAYEYYGVEYSYNSNGKYLFVTEKEFGGLGGSFEQEKLYIFNTELIKLIPNESIFINEDKPNLSFHKLVIEYLSKEEGFDQIHQKEMPKAEDPINDYGFTLFYAKNGIGLRWHKGYMAANAIGPFKIVLPYSKAKDFLTETGKEVFK
jgi:hypothetical protein